MQVNPFSGNSLRFNCAAISRFAITLSFRAKLLNFQMKTNPRLLIELISTSRARKIADGSTQQNNFAGSVRTGQHENRILKKST